MFYITQNVAFYLLYCFKRRRDNGTTMRAGYDEYMTCARARVENAHLFVCARAPLGTFFILGETLCTLTTRHVFNVKNITAIIYVKCDN